MFSNAMCVYNEHGKFFLNVYSLYIASNNVIEVCSPRYEFQLFPLRLSLERVIVDKLRINESSVRFWFRNKFPKVALWSCVEPGKHFNNMVLNFKLNVLINDTKQLTSSCEYIFYTQKKMDQMLCCDLQCKVEGAFSKNEWKQMDILCEIEHLMPCDPEMVMAYRDVTTKRILKWSLIYVYLENEKDDFSLFENPDSPLSDEQKFQEMRRIKESTGHPL